MTNQDKRAVLQAAIEKKPLQYRRRAATETYEWVDCAESEPEIDFTYADWRAKPEPPPLPKAREWHIYLYDDQAWACQIKPCADLGQGPCRIQLVHVREVFPNEGWISFKDRHPVAGQHILALAPSGSPCIWDYVYQPDQGIHATHWQPMIPLPK